MKEICKNLFKKHNIELNDAQLEAFEKFFEMLVETNKVLNLTAITEPNEVALKHFLDSVLPYELFEKDAKVVDVGTGAGFPAIPLKILRPDLQFELVDSLQKRVNFLENVIKNLNLPKISAIHSRAEDFANKNREKFDYAVARAVAPLNTLVEYLLPLVKFGGCAIIYKSAKLQQEMADAKKAIEILGAKVEKIQNFSLEENDMERNILILRKVKSTPAKYPRDKNKPKLSPIK